MPTIDEALQIGWKQHQSGNLRGAESIYRQVLQVAPGSENGWCFLGMACHDQGRFAEAVSAYQEAIRIRPNFPVALSNLGNTLKQQGKLAEAEASCREALRLKPDYSTAYNNLGVTLVAQGRLSEAAGSFERALQLMPNDAVAHANLGAALVKQGKFAEGTNNAERALRINPNYAEAHKNQAIVWLLLGDFERGWPEYEWRWKCPGAALPQYPQPRWSGEPLDGRTILLRWEQGLGDTIQFLRYARRFRDQGARVVVSCQKPLFRLLQRCDGIDQLVAEGDPLPPFDTWIPLLSIPGVLKTQLDTIPSECGYLHADPQLVTHWRRRLQAYPGLRIAIAWQGSPEFHADRQRSIPLRHFAALAAVPGVRLISLQKGLGTEQIAEVAGEFPIIQFDDLDQAHGPFVDSAAILSCVDLTISCDTSVAHLAGALGVPIWLAQTLSPDWRWFLDREDSPWYPSLRLFRQQELGDWDGVFGRMADELQQLPTRLSTEDAASEGPSAPTPPGAPATPASPADPHRRLTAGHHALVQARHGWMLFNQHDIYIGRSIDRYGEFSEDEIELLAQFTRPGDIVVEGGANIGTHVVPFARQVGPQGTVLAFEPQRLVFQLLCANVALNGLTNVVCRQQALGDNPGEIVVPLIDPTRQNNFGGLGLGRFTDGERTPLITIDSLSLPACRLIKLDVEGMEEKVLRGAARTIERCRPVVYVENDREEASAALIRFLQSLGYQLYWHTPPLFRAGNFFGNPENLFGRIVSINVLGVMPDQGFHTDQLRPVAGPQSRWNEGG